MKKRQRISRKGSRRLFTRTAVKTKSKNFAPRPMRGGIRL